MSGQTHRNPSKSRVKKGPTGRFFVAIAAVLMLVSAVYVYFHHNLPWPLTTGGTPPAGGSRETGSTSSPATQDNATNQPLTTLPDKTTPSLPGQDIVNEMGRTPHSPLSDEIAAGQSTGGDSQNSFRPTDYQHLIDTLNGFYQHLDQQPYMQAFHLKEPSRIHFSRLIQKLIDNPPVVNRETDDLFTLLKNTAHFFRILGKENIMLLKGILDREKDYLEDILKTLYSLALRPEYLQKEYSLTIPFDALYDYAGFFLNTMGGRLYLFRRDSTSRMVVSYYAILVVDRANSEGTGHHGINLKPAIDFLIEEIETGGGKLKMKDQYLDTLYDLKEKYN